MNYYKNFETAKNASLFHSLFKSLKTIVFLNNLRRFNFLYETIIKVIIKHTITLYPIKNL
jgi:hypothetical protein